jgi:hypothetical protein
LADFGANRSKPDGLASNCRLCVKAVNRDYYVRTPERNAQRTANRRRATARAQAAIALYLGSQPCVDCGEADPVVLEFDHLRDKEANISTLVRHGASLGRLMAEIEKCEVRCANCHRRATARRGGWIRLGWAAASAN